MDLKQFKPKAFFIMTAYNTEKYIEEAINSILNQSEPNFIFFLRDNGSTDKTKEICQKYAQIDNRIILFRNEINRKFSEEEVKDYDDNIKSCIEAGAEYFTVLDS
ncbi:MAG: glycosyltransferase family 2 protein, partial [Clostridiaceae bacterium]|nr:glycosyltransferase family 2 protein [Clostridiaceae bacterium]